MLEGRGNAPWENEARPGSASMGKHPDGRSYRVDNVEFGALVAQGERIIQIQQAAPVPSVLPERVWMVPFPYNQCFTDREELLRELHERFLGDQATELTQGQVLNGLGGIGKTQVAVEYAYRHQQAYRFVLWANAASQETLLIDYVKIAECLQLPERILREQDKIVAAAKQWLATHGDWLLIVDGADEISTIWPLLPTGNRGHLLLTTRDPAAGSMEELEPLYGPDGMVLLLRRAEVLREGRELEQVALADRQVAEQIVTEMGGLPLALDQAGAYIKETPLSLEEYLHAYRRCRSSLLAERGRLPDGHPPVTTTWTLSFERVEQRNPAAADLLRVCAFLAPEAIPEELFIEGARHLGPRLQSLEADPLLLPELIRILRSYSLVQRDVRKKTLRLHRLVQAVLQESLEEAERRCWAERALMAVNAVFPAGEYATWPQCERLLPQALTAAQGIEQYQMKSWEAGRLLYEAASYLDDSARYPQAEPLYQRALHIREQALGPDHPDMAYPLNGLAILYKEQGKYEQAEPLYQRALHIWEQALGPDHPQVAYPLNNLANLYKEQGKYEQAEPLYQRALHIWEQALGPDHPHTTMTLQNYASLLRTMGRSEEAAQLETDGRRFS